MNEIIYKRKSVRKFKKSEFNQAEIRKIQSIINTARPLYPDISYHVEIVKGNGKIPYFIAFCGENLENIGFVGQQISLALADIGIGSYWKMGKPDGEIKSTYHFVISMPFGKPDEPLFRSRDEFKRKSLSEISMGIDDRLEAARLAPSGLNAQDWYFVADNGSIHCYRKKPSFLLSTMKNKLNCIDMGIAICHIAEESHNFKYEKIKSYPDKEGYIYMGTVNG